jgi:hypothetical protein
MKRKLDTAKSALAGSSEDGSEDSSEDSEACSDDEGVDELSLQLLDYADEIIEDNVQGADMEALSAADKALEKAMMVALALSPDIKEMLDKALARGNDGKVPPGSSLVTRSVTDQRFLCCQISLAQSKVASILTLDPGNQKAIAHLREALIFFPRCVEALLALALALKVHAKTKKELDDVESLLKKAVSTRSSLTPAGGDKFMQREMAACDTAQSALSLLLIQEGKAPEVIGKLLAAQRFTWRLSDEVLRYASAPPTPTHNSAPAPRELDSDPFVQVFDGSLSPEELAYLERVFRPDAPFWKEHHYDLSSNSGRSVGYFSYLYPLRERAANSGLEQIIDKVFKAACSQFPQTTECTVAEWWVHTRPHCSGHQLHFDSDETKIEAGGTPHHPITSTVLFVKGDGVGGPTLVTDQTLSSGLASKGWLCHPKKNRLAIFDAKFLHGVIPGRGPAQSAEGRRLTFMCGFWKSISATDRDVDMPGPGQPFPSPGVTAWTWPGEILEPASVFQDSPALPLDAKVVPLSVGAVWQPLSPETKGQPSYQACFQGF